MSNLIIKIERPAFGGVFIGRHEGKVVMVRGGVLPGEMVEVSVDEDKKDYFTASVVKILEPSPERIEPPCEYFGICGGCSLQHVPYHLQVRIKEEILRDSLKRIAKIEMEHAASIINDDPWNYRLRAQYKVSEEGLGLHKKGTREVVKIDRCMLMNDKINEYIQGAHSILKGVKAKEFHITGRDQLVARLITKKAAFSIEDAERLGPELMDAGLSGIVISRGREEPDCFGKTYISLDLSGYEYTLSPMSFVQSNWKLNQEVVNIIREMLGPLKGRRILDLYSGAGNFSLTLAPDAGVVAVEENRYAIDDGKRNLEINGINNYRFECASSEKFKLKEEYDVIILDPPRPGIRYRLIKKILALGPETILYISCNPSTFARDLKR
ncbi:MAG TPA: class I SAM-dependent RNA methyltransferase, partial [Nitrospirae bacterium]|nr:class I SAM-dependent RNA methyltransferase [Nitrospirota bacterium]